MPKTIFNLLPWLFMLACACTKEDIMQNSNGQTEPDTGNYELTLNISADGIPTKALCPEQATTADGLNRLDLYIFYEQSPEQNFHITLSPGPDGVTNYSLSGPKNERAGILAFGNLNEDTAKYLEGKTLDQLYNETSPEAWLVLSESGVDFDNIPMAGSGLYTFNEDGTLDILLRRLMFRVDIEQLTIDFADEELKGKEVKVKNIIMANCLNYFVPIKSNSIGHFYSWYLIFGSDKELDGAFGGIEHGYNYYRNRPSGWNPNGEFKADGPGKLNGTFPYTINSNWQKDKGILNIDAEGILRDMTVQTYDTAIEEGLIVSSGDESDSPHQFAVNRCFYGLLGSGSFYGTIISDFDKQTLTPRLIIELSVDGKNWFYPIEICMPQPNTVYDVKNITIKSKGSEYSNFYEMQYDVSCAMDIEPWHNIEVPNINVGHDTIIGENLN